MLKHKFVSLRPSGSDATKLRPLNWNDEHQFDGGSTGDVLTRSTTAPDGAIWAPATAAPLPNNFLVSGGGSRQFGIQTAVYAPVPDYIEIPFDGTKLAAAGYVVKAHITVRTDDALTSVTPRIREVTTVGGVTAAQGVASTGTDYDGGGALQKQTLTLTLSANEKLYRLEIVGSDALNPIYGQVLFEVIRP